MLVQEFISKWRVVGESPDEGWRTRSRTAPPARDSVSMSRIRSSRSQLISRDGLNRGWNCAIISLIRWRISSASSSVNEKFSATFPRKALKNSWRQAGASRSTALGRRRGRTRRERSNPSPIAAIQIMQWIGISIAAERPVSDSSRFRNSPDHFLTLDRYEPARKREMHQLRSVSAT